jgi:hypothetical protein
VFDQFQSTPLFVSAIWQMKIWLARKSCARARTREKERARKSEQKSTRSSVLRVR